MSKQLAKELEVGDTLDRSVAPFQVESLTPFKGGWDGKQDVIRFESTAGERLELLAEHRLTVPVIPAPVEGIDVTTLEVDALIELCQDGNQAACAELDRRGIEPPVLEPDLDPLPIAEEPDEDLELRLAAADALRDLEERLRATCNALEAAMPGMEGATAGRATRAMVSLGITGGALLTLVDALEPAGAAR